MGSRQWHGYTGKVPTCIVLEGWALLDQLQFVPAAPAEMPAVSFPQGGSQARQHSATALFFCPAIPRPGLQLSRASFPGHLAPHMGRGVWTQFPGLVLGFLWGWRLRGGNGQWGLHPWLALLGGRCGKWQGLHLPLTGVCELRSGVYVLLMALHTDSCHL